jgi:hypothetical protein
MIRLHKQTPGHLLIETGFRLILGQLRPTQVECWNLTAPEAWHLALKVDLEFGMGFFAHAAHPQKGTNDYRREDPKNA